VVHDLLSSSFPKTKPYCVGPPMGVIHCITANNLACSNVLNGMDSRRRVACCPSFAAVPVPEGQPNIRGGGLRFPRAHTHSSAAMCHVRPPTDDASHSHG